MRENFNRISALQRRQRRGRPRSAARDRLRDRGNLNFAARARATARFLDFFSRDDSPTPENPRDDNRDDDLSFGSRALSRFSPFSRFLGDESNRVPLDCFASREKSRETLKRSARKSPLFPLTIFFALVVIYVVTNVIVTIRRVVTGCTLSSKTVYALRFTHRNGG